MLKVLARSALLYVALLPHMAAADPIELKLAYFGSDRAMSYLAAAKPFLDGVNAEGRGLIEIVLYSGGVLGRAVAEQPQVVLDGKADIAFIVPGYTPERFPDNTAIELPGLFRDAREATLVYTRLIARDALRGYEDFVVLGAYETGQETIHSRLPINSISDLKGKRIRINNTSEAVTLDKLGARPVPIPITQVNDALSSGAVDGAMVATTPLSDYGIKRIALSHYMLGISGAPLALLMNRKKFEALPKPAQEIIRKHSGEWTAARFIEDYNRSDAQILKQLKADPKRRIVYPSATDLKIAHTAFKSVITEWTAQSPRNRELLGLVEAEIATLRATP